jgi:urease gamma subunit
VEEKGVNLVKDEASVVSSVGEVGDGLRDGPTIAIATTTVLLVTWRVQQGHKEAIPDVMIQHLFEGEEQDGGTQG